METIDKTIENNLESTLTVIDGYFAGGSVGLYVNSCLSVNFDNI